MASALVNGKDQNLRSISWWIHFDPYPNRFLEGAFVRCHGNVGGRPCFSHFPSFWLQTIGDDSRSNSLDLVHGNQK